MSQGSAGRDQPAAVCAEVGVGDGMMLPEWRAVELELLGPRLPDRGLAALGRGHEQASGRVEIERRQRCAIALEDGSLLSRRCMPEPGRRVTACGCDPTAVRAENRLHDGVAVPFAAASCQGGGCAGRVPSGTFHILAVPSSPAVTASRLCGQVNARHRASLRQRREQTTM